MVIIQNLVPESGVLLYKIPKKHGSGLSLGNGSVWKNFGALNIKSLDCFEETVARSVDIIGILVRTRREQRGGGQKASVILHILS